jgi:hypothetical protein
VYDLVATPDGGQVHLRKRLWTTLISPALMFVFGLQNVPKKMQISASLSLFALITMLCGLTDLLISRSEKEAIRLALLRGWFFFDRTKSEGVMRRAANGILDAFDIVYGRRHFTWRCFRTSALLSATFVLMLGLGFSGSIIRHYSDKPQYRYLIVSSIVASLLYNIPLDYYCFINHD